MKKIYLFLFVFILHITFISYRHFVSNRAGTLHCLYAQQIDVGVGFSPTPPIEKSVEEGKNPFLTELAERFSVKEKELDKLYNRGYGYSELIKIILIAKKIDKSLEEIVKEREKGKKISKIAEEYKLNYQKIHLESLKIKGEIKSSLETRQPLRKSTTAPMDTREIEQSTESGNKIKPR